VTQEGSNFESVETRRTSKESECCVVSTNNQIAHQEKLATFGSLALHAQLYELLGVSDGIVQILVSSCFAQLDSIQVDLTIEFSALVCSVVAR